MNQTIERPGDGDCWAACLASLLELPLEIVPNFCAMDHAEGDWWDATQAWLVSRGMVGIEINVRDRPTGYLMPMPPTYCIVSGKSPRGDYGHSVIGLVNGPNIEIAHDPHSSRAGLDGPPTNMFFLGHSFALKQGDQP